MKTLIYAGDSLVTGDAIAAAVLRCGKALAEVGAAETIDIPFLDETMTRRSATLLIGPSSQIIAMDGPTGLDELVDDVVVAKLDRLVSHRTKAHAPEGEIDASWVDDL